MWLLIDDRTADLGDVVDAEVAHEFQGGPGIGYIIGDQDRGEALVDAGVELEAGKSVASEWFPLSREA